MSLRYPVNNFIVLVLAENINWFKKDQLNILRRNFHFCSIMENFYSSDLLAFNLILMSLFSLLTIHSFISCASLLYNYTKSKINPPEEEIENEGKRISNKNQLHFTVLLFIGSFGRTLFFILDVSNGIYKNNHNGKDIIPKSIIKFTEFIPTYFFGILFIVLLLNWCEKLYLIQLSSGSNEKVKGALTAIWRAERIYEIGVLIYLILMILDTIGCILLQIDISTQTSRYNNAYFYLKITASFLLLIYMDITGIIYLFFGLKLFLMLHRLSRIIINDTIKYHKMKVLIMTLIGGVILIIKSLIILYHVITMTSKFQEENIEKILFIVVPYHIITEIVPLGFFHLYFWKSEEPIKNDEKEEDVLMPIYYKTINL